jgi:hypothetical protein
MYPRPRSLELLIEIREEMARQADFDVDLFVEKVRSGKWSSVNGSELIQETSFSRNGKEKDNRLLKHRK